MKMRTFRTAASPQSLFPFVLGLFFLATPWPPAPAGEFPLADAIECTPRGGLPNLFARLDAGGAVRIAYLGGSITCQEGWRPKTLKWFAEKHPKAAVKEIYASIGGTGSDLGVFRLERDVLAKLPDLLFVEFAVNDGGQPPEAIFRTMEGIVRKTWRARPECDIAFVYTFAGGLIEDLKRGKFPRAASAMERVAGHYGIPSIHMGFEAGRLAREGKFILQGPLPKTDAERAALGDKLVFSPDAVHPYPETGHELYFGAVVRSMAKIREAGKPGPHALAAPLVPDNWERASLVPLSRARPGNGWRRLEPDKGAPRWFWDFLPEVWRAERPGAALELRFRGTAIGLYDIIGPDTGAVKVTVDGRPSTKILRFDSFCTYHRLAKFMAAEGLPDGEHVVRIEVSGEPLDKAKILSQRGEKIGDPKQYTGAGLCAGAVLLIGDLLEPAASGSGAAAGTAAAGTAPAYSGADLEREFRSPGPAWRGKPFWSWNGDLKEDELIRQIGVIRDMGMGGFFMHSRTGLATEYLGPEWFHLVNACADEAERLGLEAWLYDEDRWPSGNAGGLVTADPRYREKFLALRRLPAAEFRWTGRSGERDCRALDPWRVRPDRSIRIGRRKGRSWPPRRSHPSRSRPRGGRKPPGHSSSGRTGCSVRFDALRAFRRLHWSCRIWSWALRKYWSLGSHWAT
jgi:hypothetical protein